MDVQGIKKAWLQNKANEQETVNIDVVDNKVDPNCPVELKTQLNNEQSDKLAQFLRKVQSSIADDDEFDNSVKNKISDWKNQLENKQ